MRNADIITIMLGVNDWDWAVKDGSWRSNPNYYDKSQTYYQLGEFNSTDTSTFYGALHSWCQNIISMKQTAGFEDKHFIVFTPLITSWNVSVGKTNDWNQDKLNIHGHKFREYCTAIMEVCAYYGIPVFDANMFSGIYYRSATDNNVAETGGDGVHINAIGHALLAQSLEEFLLEGYSYKDREVKHGGHTYENGVCTDCRAQIPAEAVKESYRGKVISVLGDSISTFAGYIPTADGFNLEHLPRYPQDNLLTDVTETWWMQIINELDAKLGINDSWRGATVSGYHPVTTGTTGENAAMGNLQRIRNLGANGTPDVILFYGGTNDLAHVTKVGSFDPETAPDTVDLVTKKWDNLADGYVNTLLRLQHFYPDATIIALLPTYTSGYYSDAKLAEGNAVLAEICEHYGVTYVDLRDCGISVSNLPDNIHPDAKGMDFITEAVLEALMAEYDMAAGENIVHSVTHELKNASSSLGYYKGVSHGKSFCATITGEDLTVTVTMGGIDVTDTVYQNGVISIPSVTGDIIIRAEGRIKTIYEDHLQQLPDSICSNVNLWEALESENTYYTGTAWGNLNTNQVWSVTFPAEAKDQIWSTSFWKYGSNGNNYNNVDAVRVTWFSDTGVLKSVGAPDVYAEFSAKGYLSVPEGAVAVNVPMWNASGDNAIYLLNRSHSYQDGICTICTTETMTLRYDDHVDMTGKTVEILDAGIPTSYQVGYGVEENKVPDTAVVSMNSNTLVATGIGTAKVRIDGQIYNVTVEAAPISLMLLIGQSNMRGSEGNADQSIVCADGMVYATFGDDRGDAEGIMNVNNATNFAASALTGEFSTVNVNGNTDNLSYYPINALTEDGAGTFGPDSGFPYEWVKQTGEKVWVVNAAHGGSAISSWQPNATNFEEAVLLFRACQETLRKEIAAGHFTLSHMGYFWCQGCNDASMTAETYVQKYLAMHEGLKSQLGFDHDSSSATGDVNFEFAGIIPILYGVDSYRAGEYLDQNPYNYYQSFEQLTFNGPRVAQYWMCNNSELEDIWMVCNIGEDWVWMPDGTNGVTEYFQTHYENGTVDYTTQVAQKTDWYTPTTPKAVHDSIHYNQIGYNEIGRESVRNALIMLGEIPQPEVETTVELPDEFCSSTNLWPILPHEDVHFTSGKKWGKISTPVPSITIPVNPGDRIFATSFQKAVVNGHETSNGIRVTFFDADGIAKTMGPGQTDKEFYANGGYLIAPEGTIAVNICMWYESDTYEVYILNRDHVYENCQCSCGATLGPKITQQPVSIQANLGEQFTFTVGAEGYGLTYQWYYKEATMDDFAVSAVTTNRYSFPMTSFRIGREYYCVVTDAYGNSVRTNTVKVNVPLAIVQQPQSVEVDLGVKTAITVTTQGEGLTYQWYYKDKGMANFMPSCYTGKTYSFEMTNYRNGRQVYCVITDAAGNSITSDIAVMKLPKQTLAIVEQPTDVYASIGEKFTITVKAQGDGLTYQWYYKESSMKAFQLSSNTSASYSYAMTQYRDGHQVYCVITDQYGQQVRTNTVTLFVAQNG